MNHLWLLAALLLLIPMPANSEARYSATVQGITITLFAEKCELPEVSNLPNRATWTENGKTFEGCFSYIEPLEMLMFFFREDRSVAVVPSGVFKKVTGV